MNETYLSFYLKYNRIHIFIDALREIGSPSRICFMIGENGSSLLMTPYTKRDFKSHLVSDEVYDGVTSMTVYSIKLCKIIAGIHGWDEDLSYRVPGRIYQRQAAVVFNLKEAEIVTRESWTATFY